MKTSERVLLCTAAVFLCSVLIFQVYTKESGTLQDFHHGYALVVSNPRMSAMPFVPNSIQSIVRRQETANATLSYTLGGGLGTLSAFGAPIYATIALPWVMTGDPWTSAAAIFPFTVLCNYVNYKYLEYALSEELLIYEKEAEEARAARKDRDQKQAILREKQQALWEKHVIYLGDEAQKIRQKERDQELIIQQSMFGNFP